MFIPFTIGGGVRSVEDAQAVLDAGADKVSVNSAAVARPELLTELARVFGAQCVVLAIDARREDDGSYGVYVNGGRTPVGRDAVEWAREGVERGAGEILLTSMDRDGTEDGYELELTRAVADAVDVPVIASGGAGQPRPPRGRGRGGRRRRRAVRLDLPLRPVHACARPRSTCGRRGSRCGCEARRTAVPRCRASCASGCGACPGMERVLPALAGLPPTFLVGGAVRDLLRGEPRRRPRRGGRGRRAARSRARSPSGSAARLREHERFGTATVIADGVSLDLATTRAESLRRARARCRASRPASLARGPRPPRLRDQRDGDRRCAATTSAISTTPAAASPTSTPASCASCTTRSFVDDPTRLLRAVRYETRLGFALDADTERLARAAVAGGALATVSGARIRDELMDLLAEPEAPTGVARLRELGIAAALHPALDPDPELVASAALGAVDDRAPTAATRRAGGARAPGAPGRSCDLVARPSLHLPAAERDAAAACRPRGAA